MNKFLSQRADACRTLSDSRGQNTVNLMLYGDSGTGKSHFLSTCRCPLYVFSFDPGGTKLPPLQQMVLDGRAILDTQYELENMQNPTAFNLFDKTCDELDKNNVWGEVATVAIDSLTTMEQAVMYQILKKAGRPGTTPQQADYMTCQGLVTQIIKKFCSLPCDFVLIGHIKTERDELSGKISSYLMVAGQLAVKVPILMDEVLVSDVVNDGKKTKYIIHTQNDGKLKASTRRFGSGFESVEVPDMKYLRKKAGMSIDDLPNLEVTNI